MPQGTQRKESVQFKAKLPSKMRILYKEDGKMGIWGPASIEMVDKENDRVTSEALEEALPQLLRRARLSLEHSDQIVGDIKESFKFDEPKTVEIDGQTYERSTFPTSVLRGEKDGVPEDGLYVAGEVWSDTRQARETQKDIEDGHIDSYSISGEAIESSTQVKDTELVDDIKEMDLSAVTLCEEGMNERAKFAVVKSEQGKMRDAALSALRKSMGDEKEDDEEGGVGEEEDPDNVSEAMSEKELKETFKGAAEDVIKDHLPDSDLATKDDLPTDDDLVTRSDVEEIVDEKMESTEKLDIDDEEEDDEPELPTDDEEEEDEPPDSEPPEMPDEEEGDDLDSEPEMPEEDEVTAGTHNVDLEALKSNLPDDLYQAVADHMTDPGDGTIAMEDGESDGPLGSQKAEEGEEGEDDESPTEKSETSQEPADAVSEEINKASQGVDEYLMEVSGESVEVADDESFEKSFEREDVGEVSAETDDSAPLDAFYKSQEEDI